MSSQFALRSEWNDPQTSSAVGIVLILVVVDSLYDCVEKFLYE